MTGLTDIFKDAVKHVFEVDFEQDTRKEKIVAARNTYFRLCVDYTRLSYRDIGKTVEPNKDHATVLHAVRHYDMPEKFYGLRDDVYYIAEAAVSIEEDKSIEKQIKRVKMSEQFKEFQNQNELLRVQIKFLQRYSCKNSREREVLRLYRRLSFSNRKKMIFNAKAVLKIQGKMDNKNKS